MEEYLKLVAQYQCKTNVDVSSSESDSESGHITSDYLEQRKTAANKGAKNVAEEESGKRKSGMARLPTRRPDPNVYNRNALLARENRRKKKAHMEAVERELNETRNANKSLLKALKKQFKVTKKLEKECQYLKNRLDNSTNITRIYADSQTSRDDNRNSRAVSPDGSLISTYSGSSYEPTMDNGGNSLSGMLQIDNGSVAAQQITNETPTSSWNDFIDDLLTDYQPTPEYENEASTRLLDQTSFAFQECQQSPLSPLGIIDDEHSYFNKFTDLGVSPSWEWSSSRTPPSQLLQDDDFPNFSSGECIASL